MIADPDGILERAQGPFGERRFHRPGHHPAHLRIREHLWQLERAREEFDDDASMADIDASIRYCHEAIAAVERLEDEEKCRYLLDHLERRRLDAVNPTVVEWGGLGTG